MKRIAAILVVLASLSVGCTHNLQASFVGNMEDYHAAIEIDRREGIYAMDSAALTTHLKAGRAIAKAREVVDTEASK